MTALIKNPNFTDLLAKQNNDNISILFRFELSYFVLNCLIYSFFEQMLYTRLSINSCCFPSFQLATGL